MTKVVTTNIKESDSVFGNEGKIIPLIHAAEQTYNPPVYFVLTTCAPNIIGDDIDSVAGELEGKLGKPVIHVPSAGFSGDFIEGFDCALETTLKHLVSKKILRNKQKEMDLVNIVGYMFNRYEKDQIADVKELTVMVESLGLRVNCIVKSGQTFGQLLELSKAEVSLCFTRSPSIYEILEKELDQKCIAVDYPIGLDATERFLRTIAGVSNRERVCELYVQRALEETVPLISTVLDEIRGKKIGIFGNSLQINGLTELICDIGAEPVIIGITDTRNKNVKSELVEIIDKNGSICNPTILLDPDRNMVKEALKKREAEFVLGSMVEVWDAEGLSIPGYKSTFPLFDKRALVEKPLVGYKGVLHLVEEVGNFFGKSSLMRKEIAARLRDVRDGKSWYDV